MYYRHRSCRFFLFAAVLVFVGCAPQMQQLKVCTGAESTAESLSFLKSNLSRAVPLRANGRCRAQFFADGKKYDESFNVKLWLDQPDKIYMQGDIFFDPKGIILGSNENEFWLLIKPELSSYTWGFWAEQNFSDGLIINPMTLLESFGFTDLGSEDSWSLSKEGAFDVLGKHKQGRMVRKIYVSNCDYLIRKIEYFSEDEQPKVIVVLDKYEKVSEGLFVPTNIRIVNSEKDDAAEKVSVTFDLSSVKPVSFAGQQRNRLFTRPQPQGFMRVFRSIGDEMVEQQ